MATMAQWGSKKWVVSSSKIMALEGLSFSYAQVADENTSTEEKKTTNERGTELFPLSFTTKLHSAAGVDVRKEIESWEKLVTKTNYFYLNGKRLGPKLQLRKVTVSDVKLDDFGRMRLATLAFEFKEYEKAETTSSTGASSAKASTAEKSTKKTSNMAAEKAETHTLKKGDYVKIIKSASRYVTGEKIPDYVKDQTHKVSQLKNAKNRRKALLGYPNGIKSWVYVQYLTITSAPKNEQTVLDRKLTY